LLRPGTKFKCQFPRFLKKGKNLKRGILYYPKREEMLVRGTMQSGRPQKGTSKVRV